MTSPAVKHNLASFGISYEELGSGLTMNDLQNSNERVGNNSVAFWPSQIMSRFLVTTTHSFPLVCTQYIEQYTVPDQETGQP